jgi:mRNA-degrading endonuclease RelE of RelBE toxin-antitoxin system
VARLRQEVSARESAGGRPPARVPASPSPDPAGPPTDDPRVTELRERVAALRSALVQRHAERNELRREVERLREARETAPPGNASGRGEDGDDEPILLPDEQPTAQPPRLPVFAPQAREALAAVPQRVARAAIEEVGRLAGGAPAAFHGARRLRLDRDVWRQRVAGSYRLLFRLHPDELEVVALVHRHDLERTARTLARTPSRPPGR